MARGISLPAAPVALALALASHGCVRRAYHVPPKPGRPAATVKFRRFVVARGASAFSVPFSATLTGQWPRDEVLIDGRLVRTHGIGPRPGQTVSIWTRVTPGWHTLTYTAWYEVSYSQWQEETYYETTREPCSKYECSYGAGGYSCGMRSSWCTKQKRRTRRRLVHRSAAVDRCSTAAKVYLRNGGTYLFNMVYMGPRTCRITCHEQVFGPDRQFRLVPCSTAR